MLGKLIVFESIDGAGKGTQLAKAAAWLSKKIEPGNLVLTKEPGGTEFGDRVRNLLYKGVPMSSLAPGIVDLMFLASHIQNWKTVVEPALMAGKIVLSDRWWYSQLAYQTEREVPQAARAAYFDLHGPPSDLLIFLSADVDLAIERARKREDETHQSAKPWNDAQMQKRIQAEYVKQFSTRREWRNIGIGDLDAEQIFSLVKHTIAKELGLGL